MKPIDLDDSGELIISCADAYNRGNSLLYLPREIRDEIYELAIPKEEKDHNAARSGPKVFNPHGICQVSRQIRHETLPVFLKNTTFFVESKWNGYRPLAQSVMTCLSNILPNGRAFELVRSIHFGTLHPSGLQVWSIFGSGRSMTSSNTRRELAHACKNITNITLSFLTLDIRHASEPDSRRHREFSLFATYYGLTELLHFEKLKTIKIVVINQAKEEAMKELAFLNRFASLRKFSIFGLLNWFEYEYRKVGREILTMVDWAFIDDYDHCPGLLAYGEERFIGWERQDPVVEE